jgi:hypothetical protein
MLSYLGDDLYPRISGIGHPLKGFSTPADKANGADVL